MFFIILPISLYFLLLFPDNGQSCHPNYNSQQCTNIVAKLQGNRNRRDLGTVGGPALSNRTKRASHDWMRETSCYDVADEWVRLYWKPDSLTLHQCDGSPIRYVGYKKMQQAGYGHDTRVVTHVRSVLIGDWEPTPPNKRTTFGYRWNGLMRELGARAGDEKGHILASRFGGPADWYNLAPQTAKVNRNVGNAGEFGWYSLEDNLAKWVKMGCGKVQVDVFLNYGRLSSVRPKGFKVCVHYFGYSRLAHVESHYFENGEDDRWSDDEDPSGDELRR